MATKSVETLSGEALRSFACVPRCPSGSGASGRSPSPPWTWYSLTVDLSAGSTPTRVTLRHDAVKMLGLVSRERYEQLARTARSWDSLPASGEAQRYLEEPAGTRPASRRPEGGAPNAIAYFSPSSVWGSLPIYSGGLGVLAGDHLKAASDPASGRRVGCCTGRLLRQHLTADGWQRRTPALDPHGCRWLSSRRRGRR